MPQRRSGIQELRLSQKKHAHNLVIKKDLRKTIKTFRSTVDAKDLEKAQTLLKTVFKKIDKATKRNLLKKNTASRKKSHFSRLLKSIA